MMSINCLFFQYRNSEIVNHPFKSFIQLFILFLHGLYGAAKSKQLERVHPVINNTMLHKSGIV